MPFEVRTKLAVTGWDQLKTMEGRGGRVAIEYLGCCKYLEVRDCVAEMKSRRL